MQMRVFNDDGESLILGPLVPPPLCVFMSFLLGFVKIRK